MTLPYERTRAVLYARSFLASLSDPQQTPRVPAWVRERARGILRHYPTPFDVNHVAMMDQHIFGVAREATGEKLP